MSASPHTRISLLALASALLGPFCVTGPIAVFLGWVALRAINGSEGRLRGAPLAIAGLAMGALGIVVLVLGSLAIALLALRDASNRAVCENNLGKIGLAVNSYYDHEGHVFPPGTLPLPGRPPEERLSWVAGILAFLEKRPDHTFRWQPLALRLQTDRPWTEPPNLEVSQTNVPRFLCPAHPNYDPLRNPGLTHYVGIAGLGTEAASLPADNPRAGFFGYDRIISQADITRGLSYTLLSAETTIDNGPWAAGGPSTVRGVDPNETRYIGPGRPFGGCHRVRGVDVLEAAYADAHVTTLKATVKPRVFREEACIAALADGS